MKTSLLKAVLALVVGLSSQTYAQNLSESFEGSFPPDGWKIHNYGSTTNWQQSSYLPQNGLESARLSSGNHDDWFITPKVSVTNATDSIHFWARKSSSTTSLTIDILGSTTGSDSASFIHVIDTNFALTSDWAKYSYGLGAFIGQELYFGFHSNLYNGTTFYVDNFTGPQIYVDPCPPVSQVIVSDETSEGATFTWNSTLNAETYSYSAFNAGEGPNGASLASGSVTDTTVIVTGLPAVSNLELWFYNTCGTSGTSEVSGPFAFETLCGSETETYAENFDSYLPQCWTEAKGQIASSTIFTSTSSLWAPDGFANNGTTGAARVNVAYSSRKDWLITPTLDLDSIANSEISFFAALSDYDNSSAPDNGNFGDDDKVHIVISPDNGVTWSSDNILMTFDTANVPAHTGEFYTIDLSAYTGQVKIAFYAESTVSNENNDFFIDNFTWGPATTCLPITDIEIDSLTSEDVYISWTSTNTSTDVIIEYGEHGFDLGTGTQLTLSGTSATLSGLTAVTEYDFYIRSICTAADSSVWSLVTSVTTDCAVSETEYEQDFASYIPVCWEEAKGQISDSTVFTSSLSSWTSDGFGNVGTSGAARVNIFTSGQYEWLISSSLNLDSIPNSEISFFAALTDYGNSGVPDNGNFGNDDTVHVVISTDDGITWSEDNILMTFDTSNAPSNTGDFYSISLASYSGVVKIGFYAQSTVYNEDNDFFIDDFKWAEESNCLPVSNISIDSVFAHDAYISWSNVNTLDDFIVEYGEDGFTLGSGTQLTTTDTFITLTGLDAVTEYEFYIRSICSVGDSSIWSFVNAFTTECAELTSTYTQDFMTYVPECWEEASGAIADTTVFTSISSSWTSDGFLNNGSAGAARINIYGGFVDEWLITPTIDLDAITNSQISFFAGLTDYANSGAPDNGNFGDDDKVNIVISTDNGETWSDDNILMTFDTANVPPHTGAYYSINLSAYSGSVKIGFYAESTLSNEDNDFFIDNFVWEETPSCLPITTTTIDSIFESDVYFTIENLNSVDNFIIEYGESGFTPGMGTIVTSTDTNIHISGLTPVTEYEVYIQNVCSAGDTSIAVLPFTFTTECPIYTTTYTQDFSSYLPLCWEEAEGIIADTTNFIATSSDWAVDGFLNNGTTGAARVNISGTTRKDWLITSSLNLDMIANSHISFYAGLTDASNSNAPDNGTFGPDDKVHVVISIDNGETWSDDNILLSFDETNAPSHTGQYYSIPLSGYSGVVKIGFYAESTVSNENNDFSIDNFTWETEPSCGQIGIVNIDTTYSNSAVIYWNNPNPSTSGVTYLVEYGIPGFTLGTGTQVTTTSETYEIVGLDPVTTYEVYVTSVCAPGDTANWSSGTYFTTECAIAATYFTEDFASYLPQCWEEAAGGVGNPTTFSSTTSSSWTNDGFLNNGSSGAARINIFGGFVDEWLISSSLDLDAQTYSQIEFDAGLTDYASSNAPDNGSFGADDRVLVVISLDNGVTWSEANTLMTFDQSNTPSHLGQHYTIPLVGYSGQVKIGFYAESTATNEDNDFFIDNFQWSEAPTCLPTSVFDLDEVSDTTAVVTWTNVNGVSDYIIEYGASGFVLGTGTTVTVTDTFTTLNGLTPNSDYQIYVKAICSPTDTAEYSIGFSFSTECTLLDDGDVEDFASYLPECWTEAKGLLALNTTFTSFSSSTWTQDGYLNVGTTGSARVNVYGTAHREWLISPSINLDSSPKQIEFDAGITDFLGTGPDSFGDDDKFQVVISTDNGITWSDTNVLMTFDTANVLSNTGDHYIISLQDYSGEVQIGFYTQSTQNNNDYNVYLDNFEVKDKDITSNDLRPFGATVNAISCVGDPNQLFITLESIGLNPADSFYLDVNITGATPYNNGNVFYTQHLALGTYTPILITDVGTFAVGTYSGQAVVSNGYDTDATNDTLLFAFEIVDFPTVNAGNDVTICNGDAFQLNATGAVTYTWSGGLSNGAYVSPTTTTEYIVTGVSAAGCEDTDTITVNVISGLTPGIVSFNGYLASVSNHTTYTWTLNGVVVGTTPQIEPLANGVYTLTVTNGTGCSASVDYTVSGIGLDDFENSGVSVYPNPTSGVLNISSENSITNIRIVDTRGRVVFKAKEFVEKQINLSELTSGYYILNGEVNGEAFQTKITKQ